MPCGPEFYASPFRPSVSNSRSAVAYCLVSTFPGLMLYGGIRDAITIHGRHGVRTLPSVEPA